MVVLLVVAIVVCLVLVLCRRYAIKVKCPQPSGSVHPCEIAVENQEDANEGTSEVEAEVDTTEQLSPDEQLFWRWFNGEIERAKEYKYFLRFDLWMELELQVFVILKRDFKGEKKIISKLEVMGFEIKYEENTYFKLKSNVDYAKYVRKIDFSTWVKYFEKVLKKKKGDEGIYISTSNLGKLEERQCHWFIKNNYNQVSDFLQDLA